MFRKTKIIVLIMALLVLLGVYLVIKYTESEDRTFRSRVLSFNPELVTAIHVNDKLSGDQVEIMLEDGKWNLHADGKVFGGDPDAIANALVMLNGLSTESIVATKSSQWEEFKVDKDQAIHIEVFEGSRIVGELYVGKFDFKQVPATQPGRQPQTKMTSYVRPEDEDIVYAVNGLLRSNFQGGKTPFRNRLVLFNEPENFTKITYSSPEGNKVLELNNTHWKLDESIVDSLKTDRYIKSISRLRSSAFIDDIDLGEKTAAYSMLVEGKGIAPISIQAFPADTTIGYYITSSLNDGAVFDGSKAGLFDKIFGKFNNLVAE